MPKYSGFDPIESHNVVTTGTSISGIDHGGDSTVTAIYLPLDDNTNDMAGGYTISGPASISSAEAKFGGASALFNSSSTYLTASGSQSAMAFTGAFTIEMWVYQTATPSGNGYTIAAVHNGSGWLWQLKPTYSRFWVNSSVNARFEETLTNNTWHHLAVVREEAAGVVKFYLNGTLKATSGTTPSTMVSNRDLYIGAYRSTSSSQNFQGYIDDFRIVDGAALYTSNFTPPTSALGIHSIDPVSLYLPFDSDVNDDSSHGHTVTAAGSAAVSSTQAKFGGNSLYLSGTDDYLQIDDNDVFDFGSGDWTLETWFYQNDNTGHIIAQKRNTNGTWGTGAWTLGVNTNYGVGNEIIGRIEFFSNEFNSGSPLLEYEKGSAFSSGWHHLALSRSGGNWRLFLDGSVVDSATWTGAITKNQYYPLTIGRDTYAGAGQRGYLNGYLDDFRITKGVARYTKSFVPPNAAVGVKLDGTNETNTTTDFAALYLPFTADINDDSSHGHTMTAYGNATISSTQSKFGSNAAYFDGSGDYIAITSDESALNIGTEDFTFEAYIWLNDLSGFQTIFMTKDGTTNVGHYYLRTNGSKLQLQLGSISNSTLLQLESTTDLTAQTWTHVAATRIGSSLKLYIDGAEVGSGTDQQGTRSLVSGDFRVGIGRHGSPFQGYINDLRILRGYAKYRADFVPHTSPIGTSVSETVNDLTTLYMPFDGDLITAGSSQSGNTVLLINGETNHGGNFYDDKSTYNQSSITVSGSPSPSRVTSAKKYGDASINFDNTGSIEVQSTDFAFGTGDFTIETWAADDNDPDGDLFSLRQSGGGNKIGIVIGSGQFRLKSDDHTNVPNLGASGTTFKHHALVRYNGDISYYINGNRAAYDTSVSAVNYTGSPIISLGGTQLQGWYDGRLDDFRVSNKAVYTGASFTLPSSQFDYSYTTTQGGFEDEARNNTVTKEGNTALNISVKKFGTSSAYFDGTGDRVLVKHGGELNLSDGDFTIEGWFYFTSNVTARIFHGEEGSGTYSPWLFYTTSGGAIQFYASSNYSSWDVVSSASLGTVSLNTWTHLAVTRQGNTFRCFQDGVLKSTNTSSSSLYYNTDNQIAIGGRDGTNYMAGYADDLRIIKGKAIYTEAFTPPSSALGTELSGASTTVTTDTKVLSSTWTMTNDGSSPRSFIDMRSDNTWANNEHLQSSPSHRWNTDPGAPDTVATGGSIATPGNGYKYHVFTSPGTFELSAIDGGSPSLAVEYLVVAGGGGGAGNRGGGAGAGGFRTNEDGNPKAGAAMNITTGSFPVVVGTGGDAGYWPSPSTSHGLKGSDSSFNGIQSTGGGGGGGPSGPGDQGTGGSGGGAFSVTGPSGFSGNTPPTTPPQGNPGGAGHYPQGAGGGGGAGAAGGAGNPNAGDGGAGHAVPSFSGPILSPVIPAAMATAIGPTGLYAGGGGGGGSGEGPDIAGTGGPGGGGNGGNAKVNPSAYNPNSNQYGPAGAPGVDGTGGGGGGAGNSPGTNPNMRPGGDGGNGVVIIKYAY